MKTHDPADTNWIENTELFADTRHPGEEEDPPPPATEREKLREFLTQLLIWISDSPSLTQCGFRVRVALFCLRPDLIDERTLEKVGEIADCSKQRVHKLAVELRETLGLDDE